MCDNEVQHAICPQIENLFSLFTRRLTNEFWPSPDLCEQSRTWANKGRRCQPRISLPPQNSKCLRQRSRLWTELGLSHLFRPGSSTAARRFHREEPNLLQCSDYRSSIECKSLGAAAMDAPGSRVYGIELGETVRCIPCHENITSWPNSDRNRPLLPLLLPLIDLDTAQPSSRIHLWPSQLLSPKVVRVRMLTRVTMSAMNASVASNLTQHVRSQQSSRGLGPIAPFFQTLFNSTVAIVPMPLPM